MQSLAKFITESLRTTSNTTELYHFTTLDALVSIIKQDTLIARSWNAVSFTLDKNVAEWSDMPICLVFDKESMKNLMYVDTTYDGLHLSEVRHKGNVKHVKKRLKRIDVNERKLFLALNQWRRNNIDYVRYGSTVTDIKLHAISDIQSIIGDIPMKII